MKFDMSEAWRDASAMMAANREVLLVVAGIFFLLPNLLLMLNMPDLSSLAAESPQAIEGAMLEFYRGMWWILVVMGLASMVGNLALLALLRDTARPTVAQALQGAVMGLLPAVAVYLLSIIGVSLVLGLFYGAAIATGVQAVAGVALVLCLVALIYFSIKMSMAAPVIAIEKAYNPIRVIARSWRLTKGNSLRLFLFFLMIAVVYLVVSVLVSVVMGLLMFVLGDEAFKVASAIANGLLSTVIAVVFVAVLAAAHRQLAGDVPGRASHTIE